MTPSTRIRSLAALLLLGACNLDPKTIGDTSDSAPATTDQTSQATDDGATGESASTSGTPDTTTGVSTLVTSDDGGDAASTAVDDDGGGAASTAVDDGGEGGSTAVDTGDTETPVEVMCVGDPPTFPSFEEQCQQDADCVAVAHTVDCCGSERVFGIESDELEAFLEAEATCDAQYPQCDCLPMPTITDDGNSTTDPQQIAVKCDQGLCTSFVDDPCADVDLPPCPGECPPDSFPDSCGMPCEAEGSKCGNNIGDGMECSGGVWTCTVHPPLGEGCNLVCK